MRESGSRDEKTLPFRSECGRRAVRPARRTALLPSARQAGSRHPPHPEGGWRPERTTATLPVLESPATDTPGFPGRTAGTVVGACFDCSCADIRGARLASQVGWPSHGRPEGLRHRGRSLQRPTDEGEVSTRPSRRPRCRTAPWRRGPQRHSHAQRLPRDRVADQRGRAHRQAQRRPAAQRRAERPAEPEQFQKQAGPSGLLLPSAFCLLTSPCQSTRSKSIPPNAR